MSLRLELHRLEHILTGGGEPLAELRQLGEAARLDFLFQVELRTLVRGGPRDGAGELTPCRLMAAAQEAAARGVLPLATPASLRDCLERLASSLRHRGAWHRDRPLWWSPLPQPSPEEDLWQRQHRLAESLPSREELAAALGNGDAAPLWMSLPALVPGTFTGPLHRQLQAAFGGGALDLERAGVGADGQRSSRRSDSVVYLTGREPELLRTAPAAAAAVQWCLRHLGDRLAAALPGKAVFPPRTAMLTRYPAPSGGYHPHVDNPGGPQDGATPDNGRSLTLVLYLNGPGEECAGGEIALWEAGATTAAEPAAVLPPKSGSAVIFDARAIAHQVRPLTAGPARWALTLWFNDAPQGPPAPPLPELTLTDALLPIVAPPLPTGSVLFHDLDDDSPSGRITVTSVRPGAVRPGSAPPAAPRAGVVSTVYRGGAALDAWCAHHLGLGFAHLVLIFDHLEQPEEAADAGRLRARYPAERLTVWSGSRLAAERWPALGNALRAHLEPFAGRGSACYAVAARQTLNASVALATARGDELGGAPLDWLLHLDADELLHLDGAGRGGASLANHFAAAAASGAAVLRYVNHELLQPHRPGSAPRFKRNPRLAAAGLGTAGWAKLVSYLKIAQTDRRPYFTGYFNGKSAVAVAAAAEAAGVHGWSLAQPSAGAVRFLAGPSVLHFHFASAAAFGRKYLAAERAAEDAPALPEPVLFEPSPVEIATFERIRSLRRNDDDDALVRDLERLHAEMTTFSDADVEILDEAGLILRPELAYSLG